MSTASQLRSWGEVGAWLTLRALPSTVLAAVLLDALLRGPGLTSVTTQISGEIAYLTV